MTIHRLAPQVQHYAWGDPEFIPELVGADNHEHRPWAELWLGTHPDLPALAEGRPLAELLGQHLPYLMKVLSAARPLSIQAHPSEAQAREGFAREEALDVPLSAPHRNYRDPHAKPELIVALTDFYALCGFRPLAEIASVLRDVPELQGLHPGFEPTSSRLRQLYEQILTLGPDEADAILNPILERLSRRAFSKDRREHWLVRAAESRSGMGVAPGRRDPSLLSVLLLNLVHLRPGEGLFLDAGTLHCYLEGSGIEIMASSNNVLRGGLTDKHVDVPELLKVVRFESSMPATLEPRPTSPTEAVYETPSRSFELTRIRVEPDRNHGSRPATAPEIVLVVESEGPVTIAAPSSGPDTLQLSRGEAAVVTAGVSITISGCATLYRASVPDPAPKFRGRTPPELAFGTSGLRGLVEEITDLEAYVNTRGFLATLLAQHDIYRGDPVAIAGDLRPSTQRIAEAVGRAVVDSGFRVENLGTIPTPALIFHGVRRARANVMVTGSHIPFDRNGIKFGKPTGEILKSDERAILDGVARARSVEYRRPTRESLFDDHGHFKPERRYRLPEPSRTARDAYVRRYRDFFRPGGLEGWRVAVYQHSAVGRDLLVELLQSAGAEVRATRRSDTFVPIDTEDITSERLGELQEMANESTVEAIVSTDGDGDRPLIAGLEPDGKVRFLGGDLVGILVADFLRADAVAVPVSVNDAVDLWFDERSIPVVKTRIGSPHVIAAMGELRDAGSYQRIVGWEANGGFLTGTSIERDGRSLEPLPTRDAVLPILAILYAAVEQRLPLIDLFSRLPPRFSRAGLIDHFPRETSDSILAHLSSAEGEQEIERYFSPELGFDRLTSLDRLDGLRLRFRNGDIAHIRPSGNAPQIRIYAVARSQERADAIVHLALREPDGILRRLAAAFGEVT